MTEQEILDHLGFQSWTDHALEQMRKNLSEEHVRCIGLQEAVRQIFRNTGRTSWRMVRAVLDLQAGRSVCVTGYYFRKLVEDLAKDLGISTVRLYGEMDDQSEQGLLFAADHFPLTLPPIQDADRGK